MIIYRAYLPNELGYYYTNYVIITERGKEMKYNHDTTNTKLISNENIYKLDL